MTTRKPLVLVSGLFEELNTPTDKLDFAGNTTTDLTEGTNLYYTDTRSRLAISVTDAGGEGSLTYNSGTGVITYTGPSGTDIRSYFSVAAGSGLTYDSSTGIFGTSAIPNAQLANSSFVLGSTTVNLGDTKTSLLGFVELETTTLNIGSGGTANNISISAGNIIFEGATPDGNELTLTSADASVDRTITLPDASGTVALLSTLSATTTGTGYGTLSYNNTTGTFDFAVVTDANIRGAISVTDSGGDGSLSYNSGTGVITYTGPSASEVRAHFSVAVGSGLTYNSTSGEFGTSNIPNSQLQNSSVTVGSTAIALGSSATTIAGLVSVTSSAVITDDNGFRVRNNTDPTKQLAFDVSGVTTATTRTLTIPDANGTILLDSSVIPSDFSDSLFRVSDNSDTTKKLAFECSGITTATTRTLTIPDQDGTILLDTSTLPSDFSDSAFRVSDNTDSTKKVALECSGITTATTRTLTVPDENGTIATQDFATAIAVALG